MASKPKMKMNYLGSTGCRISDICLGAMTFGDGSSRFGARMPVVENDQLAFNFMDRFVEVGGNFIDTANVYGTGSSEIVVGKWLKTKKRDDIVVATKANGPTGLGSNDQGLSRKHLVAALEASLERLGTNYVDLYQCHAFDWGTPLKETLATLNDFVRIGKVRYIGCSNFSAWQLQESLDIQDKYNLEPFVSIQQQYSLLERNLEWDLVDVCQRRGVAILPWSPLKGGILAGKFNRDTKKDTVFGSRIGWAQTVGWGETNYDNHANPHTYALLDEISSVSTEVSQPFAAVSLRWCVQKPGITSTIIGARTMKQLEDNLATSTFALSEEQMKRLDEKSFKGLPYPYNLQAFGKKMRGRF